jgi:hypothetical protein
MNSDRYAKIVLTVIAVCLLAIAMRVLNIEPIASAASSMSCKGELQANAWGGIKETIGGYEIQLKCD